MDGRAQQRSLARELVALLGAVTALTVAAGQAAALERCKGKINLKDGAIEISAAGIAGNLFWGNQAGQETNAFANAASCLTSDKARKCALGAPGTAQRITPPDLCTVFLRDSSNAACSAYLRGCTPGVRGAGAGAFVQKSGDSMTGSLSAPRLIAGTPLLATCEQGGICAASDIQTDGDLLVFGATRLGANVTQPTGDGIVKAGLLVNCTNNGGSVAIIRQFNNLNNGSFTIDDELVAGNCTLTSPFSMSGRYVVATPAGGGFTAVAVTISGNDVTLRRWSSISNIGPIGGEDGQVFVMIY